MDTCKSKMKAVFCVVLAAIATGAVSGQFRSDYEFNADAQGWFKLHKTATSKELAETQCFFEGAVLASPLDNKMKEAMMSFLDQYKDVELEVHTGISKTLNEAQYTSVEGVSLSNIPVEYRGVFGPAYGPLASCLRMSSQGYFVAGSCGDMLPYICYKKHNANLVQTECGTVDRGYELDRRTGSCYKFHKYATNWTLAHMTCAAEGGHLAIINSDTESEVLKEIFWNHPEHSNPGAEDPYTAFIGFFDWNKKGNWRTIQGETLQEAGFANWHDCQPDNKIVNGFEEKCGGIQRSGRLNDFACERLMPFICEKNPNSV